MHYFLLCLNTLALKPCRKAWVNHITSEKVGWDIKLYSYASNNSHAKGTSQVKRVIALWPQCDCTEQLRVLSYIDTLFKELHEGTILKPIYNTFYWFSAIVLVILDISHPYELICAHGDFYVPNYCMQMLQMLTMDSFIQYTRHIFRLWSFPKLWSSVWTITIMPSPDMLQEAVTDINDPFFLGVYRLLAYLDEDRVLIAPNAPFQFRGCSFFRCGYKDYLRKNSK